jgi:hypothetical protein
MFIKTLMFQFKIGKDKMKYKLNLTLNKVAYSDMEALKEGWFVSVCFRRYFIMEVGQRET